ncbi:MAG: twin-arginine translocation signal domain-containing protein, partial [Pseudomonadota bacterium]
MMFTRRDFIKGSLALGGSLLFSPLSLYAGQADRRVWKPAYAALEHEGKFAQRIRDAYAVFENCELCPRQCGVNRLDGEKGFCRSSSEVIVYGAQPHFGEEISLVGENGSGTIFFSNCNLRCIFCQNWPIAHEGKGKKVKDED